MDDFTEALYDACKAIETAHLEARTYEQAGKLAGKLHLYIEATLRKAVALEVGDINLAPHKPQPAAPPPGPPNKILAAYNYTIYIIYIYI